MTRNIFVMAKLTNCVNSWGLQNKNIGKKITFEVNIHRGII